MLPSPVTRRCPALRTEAKAAPTCSPLITPTVTMAESAPWPLVTERASSVASSIVSTAWVAPNSCAFSRLNATGSTAMTFAAPACTAPCTALTPIPPMPITITVWPGCTAAELTAEPQPVPTAQPVRPRPAAGCPRDLDGRVHGHGGVLAEGPDARHLADRRAVQGQRKLVGSSGAAARQEEPAEVAEVLMPAGAPPAAAAAGQEGEDDVVALLVARGVRPDLRDDPGALVAARHGKMPAGMSPVAMWSSEWHSPEATILTCSSPGRGSSSSRPSTTSYLPGALRRMAPRVCTVGDPSSSEVEEVGATVPTPASVLEALELADRALQRVRVDDLARARSPRRSA